MTNPPRVPQAHAGSVDAGTEGMDVAGTVSRPDGSGQPDDAEASPSAGDRFGDMKQNLMNQWKVQESSAVART